MEKEPPYVRIWDALGKLKYLRLPTTTIHKLGRYVRETGNLDALEPETLRHLVETGELAKRREQTSLPGTGISSQPIIGSGTLETLRQAFKEKHGGRT